MSQRFHVRYILTSVYQVMEELGRVQGLRQAEELKRRKNKKGESLIHGKRKKAASK